MTDDEVNPARDPGTGSEAPDGGVAGTDDGPDLDWLVALEGRVREAAVRLRELEAENDRLEARVDELEESLEEALARAEAGSGETAGSGEAGDGDEGEGEAAAWRRERKEIRDRVQHLTEHLESLLDGDA